MNDKMKKWVSILLSILLLEGLGVLSAVLSGNIASKYADLVQVPLSPPAVIFGPVWTVLYALLGIAGYFVFAEIKNPGAIKIRIIFSIQMILNFIWCIIFFGGNYFVIASFVIIIMDIMTITMIYWLMHEKKSIALMLIPYLLWILFATYLTIGIALLN